MSSTDHKRCFHLILLAKNRVGFDNLRYLVCASFKRGYYKHRPRISHELLQRHSEGLICTSACIGGEVVAENDVHFLEKEDAERHDRMLLEKTRGKQDDPDRFRYTGQEWLKSYDKRSPLPHLCTLSRA